jgi:hypothetical protein
MGSLKNLENGGKRAYPNINLCQNAFAFVDSEMVEDRFRDGVARNSAVSRTLMKAEVFIVKIEGVLACIEMSRSSCSERRCFLLLMVIEKSCSGCLAGSFGLLY